mmetsp:Transcript_76884/g.220093  ORF Transcript_76884/g.220093 Transcript_76884/m.220093 type:complete len:262 (-) Transcript_76884:263-1048(-)
MGCTQGADTDHLCLWSLRRQRFEQAAQNADVQRWHVQTLSGPKITRDIGHIHHNPQTIRSTAEGPCPWRRRRRCCGGGGAFGDQPHAARTVPADIPKAHTLQMLALRELIRPAFSATAPAPAHNLLHFAEARRQRRLSRGRVHFLLLLRHPGLREVLDSRFAPTISTRAVLHPCLRDLPQIHLDDAVLSFRRRIVSQLRNAELKSMCFCVSFLSSVSEACLFTLNLEAVERLRLAAPDGQHAGLIEQHPFAINLCSRGNIS